MKLTMYFSIILLLFILTPSSATNIDSLIKVTDQMTDLDQKIHNHIRISQLITYKDSTISHIHALKAIELSKGYDDSLWLESKLRQVEFMRDNQKEHGLNRCLDSLKIIHDLIPKTGHFDLKIKTDVMLSSIYSGLLDYENTVSITTRIYNDLRTKGDTLSNTYLINLFYCGLSHMQLYRLPEAVRFYQELEAKAKLRNKQGLLATVYNNLAGLFSQINDTDRALEYDRKALSLVKEGDKRKVRIIYNMGNHFLDNEQLDSAKYYLNTIIDNEKIEGFTKAALFGVLAEISYHENDIVLASSYIDNAKQLLISDSTILNLNHNITAVEALILKVKGEPKSALKLMQTAISQLKAGENTDEFENLQQYYEYYFTWIGKDEYFQKEMLVDYMKVVDTLMNANIVNQTIKNEIQFDSYKKSKQLELLVLDNDLKKSKILNSKIWSSVLGLLLLIATLISYILYKRFKSKQQQLILMDTQHELLKSHNVELSANLNQARSRLNDWSQLQHKFLTLPGKEKRKIKLGDIRYIKSKGNSIYIYTVSNKHHAWITLTSILNLLPREIFKRCQKSYVINIRQIELVNSKYVEIAGEKIPIGAAYRDSLEF